MENSEASQGTQDKEKELILEKEAISPPQQNSSPTFKNAASPYTALSDSIKEGVGNRPNKIRFFGPRFMAIWVMPIALTGIVMEFLFISPLRSSNPFS